MTFREAIETLAGLKPELWNERQTARDVVTDAVWTIATEAGDGKSEMSDWIANGSFVGTETPEWLADEWNEYQRNARALMED